MANQIIADGNQLYTITEDNFVQRVRGGFKMGETLANDNAVGMSTGTLYACKYTAYVDAITTYLVAWMYTPVVNCKIKFAIYSNHEQERPENPLVESEEYVMKNNDISGDRDSRIFVNWKQPFQLRENTKYWIAMLVDTSTPNIMTLTGTGRQSHGQYWGTMPYASGFPILTTIGTAWPNAAIGCM